MKDNNEPVSMLSFVIITILLISSYPIYKIVSNSLSNNDATRTKEVIDGHRYFSAKGYTGLIHDPDCPKCKKNLIHLMDSMIKTNKAIIYKP